MVNVKTCLPVIVVVIRSTNTIDQNIDFKAVEKLHQASCFSASIKFGVKFHFFTVYVIVVLCIGDRCLVFTAFIHEGSGEASRSADWSEHLLCDNTDHCNRTVNAPTSLRPTGSTKSS